MTTMGDDLEIVVEPIRGSHSLASGSSALAGDIAEVGARGELSSSAVSQWKREADDERDRAAVASGRSPERKKRRAPLVFLAGGVAAVLAVVVVAIIALRGGGGDSAKAKRVSANDSSPVAGTHEVTGAVDTRTPEPASGAGSQMRLDEKTRRANAAAATGEGAASSEGGTTSAALVEPSAPVVDEPPAPTTPAATPPAKPLAPKRPATLGGKKVVLEYDNAVPKETAKKTPVKGDDSASIGAARITYVNGNRKLFAGDADGAIKLYKQALSMYPGYVAAYRGLGLAHAQKGDKQNALKAFRTYLSAVPGAKDVALVKKRVASLQR